MDAELFANTWYYHITYLFYHRRQGSFIGLKMAMGPEKPAPDGKMSVAAAKGTITMYIASDSRLMPILATTIKLIH